MPRSRTPIDPFIEDRIAQLQKTYAAARARIERELAKGSASSFKAFRYAEQVKQIEATIKALDVVAAKMARGIVERGFENGAGIAERALAAAGLNVGPVNMGSLISSRAVQVFADQITMDLLKANGSISQEARRFLRQTQQTLIDEKQIYDQLSRGVIEGEARRTVSRRLRDDLVRQLDEGVAKVVIRGRKYDPDYYAGLVTRTITREAATEGTVSFASEYDVDLFQVSVHENPCEEICAALQGKVFSRSGTDPRFPRLARRPPFHPHCKHVLLPYVEVDDAETEALAEISKSDVVLAGNDDYQKAIGGSKTAKKSLPVEIEPTKANQSPKPTSESERLILERDRLDAEIRNIDEKIPKQESYSVSKEDYPNLNSKERQKLARKLYLEGLPKDLEKLTKEKALKSARLMALNDELRELEEKAAKAAWMGNKKNAKWLESRLQKEGIEASRYNSPGGSIYFSVIDAEGNTIKIRVADHRAPVGGGFNVNSQDRQGDPDVDVNPFSGTTWQQAVEEIRKRIARP